MCTGADMPPPRSSSRFDWTARDCRKRRSPSSSRTSRVDDGSFHKRITPTHEPSRLLYTSSPHEYISNRNRCVPNRCHPTRPDCDANGPTVHGDIVNTVSLSLGSCIRWLLLLLSRRRLYRSLGTVSVELQLLTKMGIGTRRFRLAQRFRYNASSTTNNVYG